MSSLPASTLHAGAPVGIFDSGVGGLSVLRAIHTLLPQEALLYVADSRYAPYGERDDDYVIGRSLAIGDWLLAQGAKALVVACNTATAQTIQLMRAHLAQRDIILVGVEPAVKPAALHSARRVAGVLATASTLGSARFQALLARHGGDCRFLCVAGNGLVDAIEQGDTGSPHVLALLARYLEEIIAAGADTLVLGCTHYPFLDAAIRQIAGDRLTLIDTGAAIARQLQRQLAAHDLLGGNAQAVTPAATESTSAAAANAPAGTANATPAGALPPARVRLCSTGDTGALHTLSALLHLGAEIDPAALPIASAPPATLAALRPPLPLSA